MSLDYPLYEEMVRRKSRGRIWWRVGDFLYYLGLLAVMFSVPMGIGHMVLANSLAIGLRYLIAFVAGVVVFFIATKLKAYLRLLATQDGIDVKKY